MIDGRLMLTWQMPDGNAKGVDIKFDFPLDGTHEQQQAWMATAWDRQFKVAVSCLFGEEMHKAWQVWNNAMLAQVSQQGVVA